MKHVLAFFMLLSFMLASVDTHAGGPGRGFSSSRSSFGGGSRSSSFGGGFRSGNSSGYRSFSSSPSRTYTYRPSATRPSAPAAAPRCSYSTKTTVNNHYHGGTTTNSGGLGLMDYVILDNMLSRDRGPGYVSAPVHNVIANDSSYEPRATGAVYQPESHFWRNFLLLILGLGLLYGIYRLIREVELVN